MAWIEDVNLQTGERDFVVPTTGEMRESRVQKIEKTEGIVAEEILALAHQKKARDFVVMTDVRHR